jgi:hypothetical protein
MGLVRIHCYGCQRTVSVEESAMTRGLQGAGWAVSHGETFCPSCSAERQLATGGDANDPAGHPAGERPAGAVDSGTALAPFAPRSGLLGESRWRRAQRLLGASLKVLRSDPQLVIFPAVAMALSILVGAVCFAIAVSGAGTPHNTRGVIFLASLVAAYPINFVSLYCGVALAAVLGARLRGEQATPADGWKAARERVGIIAAWTVFTCTVGALLRLVEQYVPLGAKIVVAIADLSWTLLTMFAVPILAYENLGPRETLRRSSQIFRQRWGTQLGGMVGIGVASVLLYVPFVVLLIAGAATPGATGVLLVVLGGAGLFGAIAVQAALDQIFRVFVYRSAVGLDTSAGPFDEADLQTPFAARRRGLFGGS